MVFPPVGDNPKLEGRGGVPSPFGLADLPQSLGSPRFHRMKRLWGQPALCHPGTLGLKSSMVVQSGHCGLVSWHVTPSQG